MKPILLSLCLTVLPLSAAHASIGSSGKQSAMPTVQTASPDAASAPARQDVDRDAEAATPRRSRMAEADPEDGPVMKLSAMYRVVGRDPASKDNCLKGTGSRLKRDGSGSGACSGHGQAFIPDR